MRNTLLDNSFAAEQSEHSATAIQLCLPINHPSTENPGAKGFTHHNNRLTRTCLEALAVHDGWAALVVLGLGDPHLLEGAQAGQDGATNPDGVLALLQI